MKRALDVAKLSYQQEFERSKKMMEKTDYLIKYITILAAFLGLMLKVSEKQLESYFQILWVKNTLIGSVIMLVLTILVLLFLMRPVKIYLFPTGVEYLELLQEKSDEFDSRWKFDYYEVLQYSKFTNRLKNVNRLNIVLITISYISFSVSIICSAVLLLNSIYS